MRERAVTGLQTEKRGSVPQATLRKHSCLLLATCVVNVCKWYGPGINLALKRTVVKEVFFPPLSPSGTMAVVS